MRRITLVLTATAVMVAMLVAFSAPALADKNNNKNHHGDRHNNDVVFVVNDGFGGFDHDVDFDDGDDLDIDFDDGDGDGDGDGDDFSPLFVQGCWEWSWVFERWEYDCD